MPGTSAPVTPAGVRDGDPQTLQALCEKRGAAVLAYCEQVCAPGEAVAAAADAFARFRSAVVSSPSTAELNPEELLLTETRHAAAERAPRARLASGLARRLGARGSRQACELVPDLLVARAEQRLSQADEQRLDRHLERCTACHAASRRFQAAHEAYADPPDEAVTGVAAHAIVSALAGAAPVRADPPVDDPPSPEDPPVAAEAEAQAAVEAEPEAALEPEAAPEPDPPVADPNPIVPPDLDEVVITDARGIAPAEPAGTPEAHSPDEPDDAHAVADAGSAAAVAEAEEPLAFEQESGNGAVEAHAIGPEASNGLATITVRGHPEDSSYLPEMPSAIAPRPGHHPRRRRHAADPSHRHGPAWGLLLPAAVLVAAAVVVLALAGVFAGGGRHAATPPAAATSLAASTKTAVPATTHHRTRHRARTHRTHSHTTAASTRSAAASRAAAVTPVAAAPPATRAPVTSAAPVRTTAPVQHTTTTTHSSSPSTSSAPTTVQAVGPPSSAAPPSSGGAPSTGGTGYQPGG